MIGDIDFIIQHKDEEKIKRVLEKNKYYSLYSDNLFNFFKPKHLPRLLHKNKIIGIEIHTELLPPLFRFVFSSKELVYNFKEEPKKNETPSKSFLFYHCIYGLQIDDQAFFTNHHSHRNTYDIYKLDCKNSLTIKNGTKDIYVRHFFLTIAKFKIFDLQIPSSPVSLYYDKCLRGLITFYYMLIIKNKFFVLIQLLFNTELRKRGLNKVTYHYANKTLLNYIYRWVKI